jgi:PDZ domain
LGKSLSSKKTLANDERKSLEELVTLSFDTRQEMQQNEARLMTLKLEKVNENLTVRQKFRSRIVEKRVAELLDPSSDVTSWKTAKTDPNVALDRSTDLPRYTKLNGFRPTVIPETEIDRKAMPAKLSEEAVWEQVGLRLSPLPASSIPIIGEVYRGGLRVVNVRTGSPADEAGLQFGDIIVGVMDWQVISMHSLVWVLSNPEYSKRSELNYYIFRKGKRLTLAVPTASEKTTSHADEKGSGVLANTPAKAEIVFSRPSPNQQTSPAEFTRLLREKKELFDKLTRSLETCQVTFSKMSDAYKLRSKPDLALEEELTKKQEEISSLKRSLKATRDDWTQTWNSYQRQLRLAGWDVRDANEKVGAWRMEMEQTASLLKDGKVSTQANEEIVSRHKLALAKLERAMEQDTLYREIESQAELNPSNAK